MIEPADSFFTPVAHSRTHRHEESIDMTNGAELIILSVNEIDDEP